MRRPDYENFSWPMTFVVASGLFLSISIVLAAILTLAVSAAAKIVLIAFGVSILALIFHVSSINAEMKGLSQLSEMVIYSLERSRRDPDNKTSVIEDYNDDPNNQDDPRYTTIGLMKFFAVPGVLVIWGLTWLFYAKVIPLLG